MDVTDWTALPRAEERKILTAIDDKDDGAQITHYDMGSDTELHFHAD